MKTLKQRQKVLNDYLKQNNVQNKATKFQKAQLLEQKYGRI